MKQKGLRKDGTSMDIEVRGKNFEYEGRIARLVTVQDLRDRHRAEKARITAQTMAENVRLRDEFISLASHELKTPITSLKLQTQLIERGLHRPEPVIYTPAKIDEFILMFNRQVDRLLELVETMLDVSKISAGQLSIHLQKMDVSKMVQEVVSILRISHKTLITIEAPDSLIIDADPSRFRQVVENILGNALKYGEGKPIQIKIEATPAELILSIQDHGPGIAPEFMQRIFNRFERGISPRNISGLGLGLYIARQIMQAHHGKIQVDSKVGAGTVFTIRLPRLPLNGTPPGF